MSQHMRGFGAAGETTGPRLQQDPAVATHECDRCAESRRLVEVLRRVTERLVAALGDVPEGHAGQPDAPARPVRRILVPHRGRHVFVTVSDIEWFEADGNYVFIHAAERYRIRSTLTALLQRLDPHLFVRIHKSYAVNLGRVREVQPWVGGDYVAIVHGGRQIRVSRHFAATILRPFQ